MEIFQQPGEVRREGIGGKPPVFYEIIDDRRHAVSFAQPHQDVVEIVSKMGASAQKTRGRLGARDGVVQADSGHHNVGARENFVHIDPPEGQHVLCDTPDTRLVFAGMRLAAQRPETNHFSSFVAADATAAAGQRDGCRSWPLSRAAGPQGERVVDPKRVTPPTDRFVCTRIRIGVFQKQAAARLVRETAAERKFVSCVGQTYLLVAKHTYGLLFEL